MDLRLLLGTHNQGKAIEISNVFRDLGINFFTLRAFPQAQTVKETGATYEENAILKARGYARQSGLWTLADDSGLEVDALDGAPGVLSARYAGAGASDKDRIDLLLEQLSDSTPDKRTARFVSVVALADSNASVVKVEYGVCEGTVVESPRGTNGFGYDPIFVPRGFSATFAELPSETKDVISHRGKALEAMRGFLAQWIASNSTASNPNLTRGDSNS
jgi:XTP/dITP diphosphohydrolase